MSTTALSRKRRRTARTFADRVWFVLGIGLLVAFCLAPFYWMLVSSLKAPTAMFNNELWPSKISTENFEAVFSGGSDFTRALWNSFVVAGSTTMIAMLIGVFSAYALTRLQFRGRNVVLAAVLAASMFPGVAILTPLYQMFADWGWINTYQAMIVPDISFALPLAIWTLTTFFNQMPWELEQAAKVDGATPGQAFRKIIMPLAAPGLFTTTILVFITAWNEYLIASNVSIDASTNPVTVAIAKFTGESQFEQPFGTQMAAGVIATIPLVLMVLLFQRRIVAGLTAGGLK
ncbi:carbohydrate ABC transporter permease [Oerskovia turbata]|uniref:Carbohydrate ABC transporter permease n=1 Tax=Oerskovia turbata TaxID=1713 RepID=A0A4Q1L2Y9_9CELL|nr:carbohydrate ABC transporter permease [Oerskovia turbata]RXR27088.1 carbohydrate ABC transporter permease [Oerskovia turbata]RXR36344.1 carbohydrate ABC transporter permease [Oerskovia turbata]TGJ95493.1 carbohydrate ABC transporter permease [Actinotalea fermentans ATCC 43279 = JCM 9966 = DSM 3133]